MAATEIQGEAHCACTLCQVSSVEKLPTFHLTIALQCCNLSSIPKGEAETSPKGTETLYHKPRTMREHVAEKPPYRSFFIRSNRSVDSSLRKSSIVSGPLNRKALRPLSQSIV